MTDELTLKQFEQAFYDLYSKGDYSAAYELVTREMGRFPDWAQSSYYNWRMCAACLMGQPDLGLRIFEEALAAGHWYDEAGLRKDSDLAALQGNPTFERLVATSLERREAAIAHAQPELLVFEPMVCLANLNCTPISATIFHPNLKTGCFTHWNSF